MGNPIKFDSAYIAACYQSQGGIPSLHLHNKMKIVYFIVCAVLYQCSTTISPPCPCGGNNFWPPDCPPEPIINLCPHPPHPFYNESHLDQMCSTPTCIEPLLDCFRNNCSEQRATFYENVVCSRNNQGHLCWNLFGQGIIQKSIICNSCPPQSDDCTAACNIMVQSIIDQLGCCAASFLNNTNFLPDFIFVPTTALNDCNVTIGEKCTGPGETTVSNTPSPSPLTSLTLPSPSTTRIQSPTQTPTGSGSTFKANVVVLITTLVVLLASLG